MPSCKAEHEREGIFYYCLLGEGHEGQHQAGEWWVW